MISDHTILNPESDLNNHEVPIVTPEEFPAPQPRNQHLRVPAPKNRQLTARATETDYNRINTALQSRKQDIVQFCLDMMDHIEADIFQTFKTQ